MEQLYIGLCGQVSSVLLWDEAADKPVHDAFPIWMDTTCAAAVQVFSRFCSEDRDFEYLATYFPAATNWLAVKLIDWSRTGRLADHLVLQIHDAVFYRLTGECLSHPSSQVSLINHHRQQYSPEILSLVGVREDRLPSLAENCPIPMRPGWTSVFELPDKTFVLPGMMDTTTALLGVFPEDKEGVIVASTSEIIGQFHKERPAPRRCKLITNKLGKGWIDYGTTSSGGHTVQWLCSLLGSDLRSDLPELSSSAATVRAAQDGLFCLPFLAGERTPLWDSSLSGVFCRTPAASRCRAYAKGGI